MNILTKINWSNRINTITFETLYESFIFESSPVYPLPNIPTDWQLDELLSHMLFVYDNANNFGGFVKSIEQSSPP